MRILLTLLLGASVFFAVSVQAVEPSEAELEAWLESDDPMPPSVSTDDVNEGQLVFLTNPPVKQVHHHSNQLVIDADSVRSGWISLRQCHENLDRVARAQILFNRERVRDLEIISSRNIEQSWVEKNTVQLMNIHSRARLCVKARSRALIAQDGGKFLLSNGPFMRRFLDGYYPMRVSMDIDFSNSGLQLLSVLPMQQQGFKVESHQGHVSFDAWFEGQLRTKLMFAENTH
jgi:hypothetical protein